MRLEGADEYFALVRWPSSGYCSGDRRGATSGIHASLAGGAKNSSAIPSGSLKLSPEP